MRTLDFGRVMAKLKRRWRVLTIVLAPLILLPLPLISRTIEARCAYIVVLLTVYYVSEAIPYAVTSLLPLAFFPMAGIVPGETICLNYFKDITTLFVGSMILACTMEHVQLHRRLALFVLSIVGSSTKWSMAGLMCVTAFLSMWISNSAATSIMIPAAVAIIDEVENYHKNIQQQQQTPEVKRPPGDTTAEDEIGISRIKTIMLEEHTEQSPSQNNVSISHSDCMIEYNPPGNQSVVELEAPTNNSLITQVDYRQLKSGFLISVAYSSGIGGLVTLVGTGTNIFTKGFVDQYYATGKHAFKITFSNFMLFGLPLGVIMLVLCWLWLQILYNRKEFFHCKKDENARDSQRDLNAILKKQYDKLGPYSWRERVITILFIVLVVLWVTRDFSSTPGWQIIFRKNYVTDGTTAILFGTLPLILPDQNPFQSDWKYQPIIQWNQLMKTFPWGVFMLQGAGLAIADGFKASDLSTTIATIMHFIVGAPKTIIILVVIIISAAFTEFTSNIACASILFPILDSIAHTANMHAAYLIMASCMGVSLSFMLPIATPPNAMIFSSGHVRMMDMIKAGIGMKIIGICVVLVATITLVGPIFHVNLLVSHQNFTTMTNSSIG
ncbi:unnamed protein product [Rotaria socialis]|uniref:Uncharacterized protein n=2 Tax=Rotaria socialis TaxID=392032 RepID=A0A817ZSJ6_9BILA|nr:unnamed protein product [Rotaria socialis]CAF4317795.1 unnamed protein product [Rotaria socialis]